jgi:tRNA nucleotidyltransferase/poly(A) polymerase
MDPRIIPREDHPISRRDIDPDALKVLYRLRQYDHVAYLVGGSVRDLILGRRPKDFDIGTSAHPYQVKKLFRNCWIIGRRFRLAHVKFGQKVIEVATFRRQVAVGEEVVADGVPAPDPTTPEGEHLLHHDNTFGTPEEDAFRRDFTINALAYDISNFSVIDYVGGLEDLRAGVVRSIGDPHVRLHEDPVRMLRAIAIAARLDFTIEPALLNAIRTNRQEIAKSSQPRLLEEYYKILRAGSSEKTFRGLAEVALLEPISAELHQGAADPLWRSLAALDAYRRQFESTPDTLTNAILLGSLLVPLGISLNPPWGQTGGHTGVRPGAGPGSDPHPDPHLTPRPPRHPPGPKLGELPLARRDVEHLRLIMSLQRRLRDLSASPKAQQALVHRGIFRETLTWLEIHGGMPDVVEHWKTLLANAGSVETPPDGQAADPANPVPSRRRRRRRGRRRRGSGPPQY